jgi:tRNA1Val (adenine37-N6)-methyltransferase
MVCGARLEGISLDLPVSTQPGSAPWPADAIHDRLIGDVWIYQRRGGHRTGTDDVLTAWYAVHCRVDETPPTRYLDLGCGVGSVMLMTAHRLRPLDCVGVEALAESVALATRALAELPAGFPRARVLHADFRELALETRFPLITASPPYFPTTDGSLPRDPQRLACRFETRGGVEAYCEAAARHLEPDGRFYLVHQTAFDKRVRVAAQAAQLFVHSRVDAWMRRDRSAPFLTVYELAAQPPVHGEPVVELAIRGMDGEFTPEYRRARRELGTEQSL